MTWDQRLTDWTKLARHEGKWSSICFYLLWGPVQIPRTEHLWTNGSHLRLIVQLLKGFVISKYLPEKWYNYNKAQITDL